MSAANRVILPAGLYFLATPIGTARDITLRALDILASADVLAAEDTRSLRKLMDIHGVALNGRNVLSYHDHSGEGQRARLLRALEEGKSVAYASEAGTPLIADPGYQLGRVASDAGHLVTAAPGPSALLTALAISGLATDSFFFAGFAPSAKGARQNYFRSLAEVPGTLVFYESPNARGEKVEIDENSLEDLLKSALKSGSVKDAVANVVEATGAKRRRIGKLSCGAMCRIHCGTALSGSWLRHCRATVPNPTWGAGPDCPERRAADLYRAERVSARQMKRLFDCASVFLAGQPRGQDSDSRFDVALVDATGKVEIVENALAA